MSQLIIQLGDVSKEEAEQIDEIFNALVKCGGLTKVKAGRTIIHFNYKGTFKSIGLDYKPWIKREKQHD